MSFQFRDTIGVSIKKAARLFEQFANNDLSKFGVTYAQTTLLVRLWDRDGQTQMELSRSSGLKQPSVVRLLDRMEKDELIKRTRNQNDGRSFNFFLTKKAKQICKKLELHALAMQEITTLEFTKEEIRTLAKLMDKVIKNLQFSLDHN